MEQQAIIEVIVQKTMEVIPDLDGVVLSGDDQFEDFGANSVDRADIIALVLESLMLNIPRVEAFGPSTISGLADLLHEKLAER